MGTLLTRDGAIDLRAVAVRPTWGAEEHRRWDRLVAAHHYLPFHGVFGKGLRHVATLGSSWLALIGWQPGAFKLAARDRWIGWSAQQQFRRLHLIANNARFVILTPRRVPNLASRVLALSLRRVSRDMRAAHGYPVLLAGDVRRPRALCRHLLPRVELALAGSDPRLCPRARRRGALAPSRPTQGALRVRTDRRRRRGAEPSRDAGTLARRARTEPMAAPRLRSLFECLGEVPECRHARGKRYPLKTVLALAVAARLAGYRGVTAFSQFAGLLGQDQLKAVGAFHSERKQRYPAPSITTFHNILAALPPETLDNAISNGPASTAPLAPRSPWTGKTWRGASKQTEEGRLDDGRGGGTWLRPGAGQKEDRGQDQTRSRRARAVQRPRPRRTRRHLRRDARPARTARCLLEHHADYVVTAIKDNQPTMLDDLGAIDWSDAPWPRNPRKGPWPDRAPPLRGSRPLRRRLGRLRRPPRTPPAMRIERERERVKDGSRSTEVTYCLTSARRRARRPGSSWRWSGTTGTSKTGCTTCATSPTMKTVAGRTCATCRAISPA